MGTRINLPKEKIKEFCQRWKITELALFGSALRDDFHADSDIDILVTFNPDAHWSLFDLADMKEDLERIVNRKVDLVSKPGIESSRNYLRRESILSSAEIIHVSG